MPPTLARIGLDAVRRADQSKVNAVLYAGTRPLLDELAASYDPSFGFDAPGSFDDLELHQYSAGLRERAWRLAEQLAAAPNRGGPGGDRGALRRRSRGVRVGAARQLRLPARRPRRGAARRLLRGALDRTLLATHAVRLHP